MSKLFVYSIYKKFWHLLSCEVAKTLYNSFLPPSLVELKVFVAEKKILQTWNFSLSQFYEYNTEASTADEQHWQTLKERIYTQSWANFVNLWLSVWEY